MEGDGNLDKYLIEFEANFIRRGGKVILGARCGRSAGGTVEDTEAGRRANRGQVEVDDYGRGTRERSIGRSGHRIHRDRSREFIVQLREEHPYHIVTPAMHLSKEDVAKTFHEKYQLPIESTPKEITAFVRKTLREKYQRAEVGITGANFLIADTGGVAVTENEGNGLMSISFPRVQIAIAGIEKIIPSLADLDIFWPLLATHGTGQNITVYNSISSGPGSWTKPKALRDVCHPARQRTHPIARSAKAAADLYCIRCGACLNGCPIYKGVGGHAYGSTYSGPIGSVITRIIRAWKNSSTSAMLLRSAANARKFVPSVLSYTNYSC